MFNKPLTVLGINPGTRYLGIAIFKDSDLREWRIKVFSGKFSDEKLEKTLRVFSGIIDQYEPDALAIKKLTSFRSSSNLNRLVRKIKELSDRKELPVHQYSIKDVEFLFSVESRVRNKKQLAEALVFEYPILAGELQKMKNSRNPYHIRMFEAVALAAAGIHQLDCKKHEK